MSDFHAEKALARESVGPFENKGMVFPAAASKIREAGDAGQGQAELRSRWLHTNRGPNFLQSCSGWLLASSVRYGWTGGWVTTVRSTISASSEVTVTSSAARTQGADKASATAAASTREDRGHLEVCIAVSENSGPPLRTGGAAEFRRKTNNSGTGRPYGTTIRRQNFFVMPGPLGRV